MSNFAAIYGLARSGTFDGLFDLDFALTKKVVYGIQDTVQYARDKRTEKADKEWNAPLDRFADAPFHSSLVENYLKGGAKLVWDTDHDLETNVRIKTKKGKEVEFQGESLKSEEAAQYRAFIENKLEMIEPPSFLEKLMIADKKLGASKSGKIAGAVSLGVIPAAVGVAALSARAYGATRGFVMNKLNLHKKAKVKDKRTFAERLSDIKRREDYKKDLKILPEIENVMQGVNDRKREKGEFLNKEASLSSLLYEQKRAQTGVAVSSELSDLVNISDHPVLSEYLDAKLSLSFLYGDSPTFIRHYVVPDQYRDQDPQDLAKRGASYEEQKNITSASVEPYMERYSKALEMIEPPTKTELTLLRQLYQLKHPKQAPLSERRPLVEAACRTLEMYVTEKQKENKDFGKTAAAVRLNDVRKHAVLESRLQKMTGMHTLLKKHGR